MRFEIMELSDPLFRKKNVTVSMARLDKIHPIVSGNKLFKLTYFLEEALSLKKDIITFGGAYSNHLVATAFAAKEYGIRSVGIVRGERPVVESSTLKDCRRYDMDLQFISREKYREIQTIKSLEEMANINKAVYIPEGGFHPMGAKGAGLILKNLPGKLPDIICVPVGTSTTLAGLLVNKIKNQRIFAFPALKGMDDQKTRLDYLAPEVDTSTLYSFNEYHFGGYAKHTPALLEFMNTFYRNHLIPLDFVYTAKMMYGVMEEISKDTINEGSHILCLHTGGLQGNSSLNNDQLIY